MLQKRVSTRVESTSLRAARLAASQLTPDEALELITYLKAKARTSTAKPVADRGLHELEAAWGSAFPGTHSPLQLKLDASDRAALQQRLKEFDDAAVRLKLTPQGRSRLWCAILTWWENDCLKADYAPTPTIFIRRPMNIRAVLRAVLPYPTDLVSKVLNSGSIANPNAA